MAAAPSRSRLLYGRDEPPAEPVELRAGPLTALLEGADLRNVRLGAVELCQRVYVAVRDEVWNTIPGELSDVELDRRDDSFAVRFRCRHRYGEIDFAWDGRIDGSAAGVITFALDGTAASTFRYAKIGFNVHHGDELAGHTYRASSSTESSEGSLPVEIEPQRVEGTRLTALFPPYDRLELEVEHGVRAGFDFEGDLWEMQDHRNWTDGNFKSYGTPMDVPWPFDAAPGKKIRQGVSISAAAPGSPPAAAAGPVRISLGDPTGATVPPVGLALASHGSPLGRREAELLRLLAPAHLRVDLYLGEDPEAELERALEASRLVGAPLELALLAADESELDRAAQLVRAHAPDAARVVVFNEGRGFASGKGTTPAAFVAAARERLGDLLGGVPFFGGTNQFFAELNRDPPDASVLDGVVFSVNPQVHACDDRSLFENLRAQADAVENARRLAGGKPVAVSPVTFVGRFGPYPAGPPSKDGLPGNVDRRQASLLGAAWTAGSVKYLTESAAASVTYFETTGWLGVVEREEGSPRPDAFPSVPGEAFPLFHVLADAAGWRGARVRSAESADRLTAVAVAVEGGVLVANVTPREQEIELDGVRPGTARLRRLDAGTAWLAATDAPAYRAGAEPVHVAGGELRLELAPYAVVRIDG